jgi:hypothetical protein
LIPSLETDIHVDEKELSKKEKGMLHTHLPYPHTEGHEIRKLVRWRTPQGKIVVHFLIIWY